MEKGDCTKLNLGNILKFLQRREEALLAYDKAIQIHRNNPIAYANIGEKSITDLANILLDLQRYEEAEIACDKAILLDTKCVIPYLHKGEGCKRK